MRELQALISGSRRIAETVGDLALYQNESRRSWLIMFRPRPCFQDHLEISESACSDILAGFDIYKRDHVIFAQR
jgi:hypothetical protein